jgi:O-acetyl-ADP-ribose deacetylase
VEHALAITEERSSRPLPNRTWPLLPISLPSVVPLSNIVDSMGIRIVTGNLLDQEVEVIVNAWNRNLIPWWLLLPQGVSGAIKRRGGTAPFQELRRAGLLPLGGAVVTSAGRLPFKAIIHVAGIGYLWRSSETSIRRSVRSALAEVDRIGCRSIAFPLIGAGTGGGSPQKVLQMICEEIECSDFSGDAVIVRYAPAQIRKKPRMR